MQFGFQVGIAVQHAILQAQSNSDGSLHHVSVLDLAKSYDKVDRFLLQTRIVGKVDVNCMRMVMAALGTLWIRTRRDPTDYCTKIRRGVPQGATFSMVYFTIYVHKLADAAERRITRRETGLGVVLLVADDVFLRAST